MKGISLFKHEMVFPASWGAIEMRVFPFDHLLSDPRGRGSALPSGVKSGVHGH